MAHSKPIRVLGISDGHDAGCALIEDGVIIAAYEEERFSRKKGHNASESGLPARSLEMLVKDFNLTPETIDAVAFAKPGTVEEYLTIIKTLIHDRVPRWIGGPLTLKVPYGPIGYVYPLFDITRRGRKLDAFAKKFGFGNVPRYRVDHHASHAASAYYTSGWNEAVVLTLDGQGSGLSGSVSIAKNGHLKRVQAISKYNSIGMLYSAVTRGLGFRPNRHEGKILGLAAHGDAAKYRDRFKKMFSVNGLDMRAQYLEKYWAPLYPHFTSLDEVFKRSIVPWYEKDRENLAAALQECTETVIIDWVRNIHARYPFVRCAVAGGVFSNVRVNQRLAELPFVEKLHVYPAMNDGGLAAGAALHTWNALRTVSEAYQPPAYAHTYLGHEHSDEEMVDELHRLDIRFTKPSDMADAVAELLAAGKVVARYTGRAEHGPRALGHRSMLYNGKDATVNTWLNRKLDRTEFMPFAPSALAEDVSKYFKGAHGDMVVQPASFMTITFDCTDAMREECPAAVHVDNTARPQFVHRDTNPDFHAILSAYKRRTGSSVVVNTSFNVHEEPIVQTPKDALKSFLLTRIDALAIGTYLVLRSEQ